MSGAPRVQLLSHFGPPVQGLSPYADALLAALHAHGGVDVVPVGYRAAYPGWLHHYNHHRGHTSLNGKSPIDRVPNLPGQNT